jgi:hypothetical protein
VELLRIKSTFLIEKKRRYVEMSQGEDIIAKILSKAKIEFDREKTFTDLKKG